MSERPTSHTYESDSRFALYTKYKESGDTAGLFSLYQEAMSATVESEYTSGTDTEGGCRSFRPRTDELEDAWHNAHLANTRSAKEGRSDRAAALSVAIATILTTTDVETLHAQIDDLDRLCEEFYIERYSHSSKERCEPDADHVSLMRQAAYIVVHSHHYESKLFQRTGRAETPDHDRA